jgi:hypothetical protein
MRSTITPHGWALRRTWRRFIVGATLMEGISVNDSTVEDVAPWLLDMKRLIRAGIRFCPAFLDRVREVELCGRTHDDEANDPDDESTALLK